MVYWSGADVAALSGRSHCRSHSRTKRRRCTTRRSHELRRRSSRNARVAWNGLGRRTFNWRAFHAHPPTLQFWNHSTVSIAPLRKGGTMKITKLALLVLLGSMLAPIANAQIKHIEMRVEGMT